MLEYVQVIVPIEIAKHTSSSTHPAHDDDLATKRYKRHLVKALLYLGPSSVFKVKSLAEQNSTDWLLVTNHVSVLHRITCNT